MSDDARIRLLPSEVIDHIAAGEVVERPSSVLKELFENAVDAGARNVQVALEGGGLSRLTVTDDGQGMSTGDLERSVLRHATSKLARAEDLFRLETLGFRGEALSSIAAVSHLTITTRRSTDAAAARLAVVGGTAASVEQVGAPVGTCVEVRELFFNTPARRKFVRSTATEQAHCVEAALRVALGTRHGGVVVAAGERRLLDISADADERARVESALAGEELSSFSHRADPIAVSGYVGRLQNPRSDTRGIWLFVNGRFVRDRMLQRAALDGLSAQLERGRFPTLVLFVDLPPAAVDVNVHPQKTEVRFADGPAVYRAVNSALARVATPRAGPALHTQGIQRATERYFDNASLRGVSERRAPYAASSVTAGGRFSTMRILGWVAGDHLACAGEDSLVIIDGRAARARIASCQLARELAAAGQVSPTRAMLPEVMTLEPKAQQLLARCAADVEALGFELEPVGPSRFAVRAVPAVLEEADLISIVSAMLAELEASTEVTDSVTRRRNLAARCARDATWPTRERDHDTTAALLAALDELGDEAYVEPPIFRELDHGALAALLRRA